MGQPRPSCWFTWCDEVFANVSRSAMVGRMDDAKQKPFDECEQRQSSDI